MSLTNHDRIHDSSHTSHLPRGFFKKKKPPDDESSLNANSFNLRCKFSSKRVVNTSFLIVCIVIALATNAVNASNDFLSNTIEGSIIATTPAPIAPADGICRSIHIRFELERITDLTGCRVVEGSVAILLLDEIRDKDIANISFPDLVEITGYLMLYRISGFTSLHQLFPNLAVIRGRTLFKDYALIIYEMLELENIGLSNLVLIERGNVRIEKNEKMCYVDTINWARITMNNGPYLEKNKLSLACPNCPVNKCTREGRSYCWNAENCQKICPHSCNSSSCTSAGVCCDAGCIGGCADDNPKKCVACRKFSIGSYPNIECVEKCPEGTYAYHNRRCLTRKECFGLNKVSPDGITNSDNSYFPFNESCAQECPQGYSKHGSGNQTSCRPCADKCLKRCQAKIVDSIATAQALKGCSIIEGPLEIQIRGTTKNQDGSNIVKELEASLHDIVEIDDYLKIARSHPILSLSFLKNLKKINGKKLESNRNALVVWENQNLQELWDENQKIEIGRGKLFFHFNPKLCFYKIEQLANKSSPYTKPKDLIENYDTAKLSNGDKTPCNVTPLNVTVVEVFPQAALLSWPPLKLDDDRSLLNYVVFYITAPHQNVTLWDGRDACGNDGWSVEDVNTFSSTDQINQPLTKLEPYTQYAYYVKAYTLATEQRGAQSDIKYFTTRPDQPTRVRKMKAVAIGPDRIEVTWETLQKVNGQLEHYILRAKAVDQNENLLSQRDYCYEPISPLLPSSPSKDSPSSPAKDAPKVLDIAPNGACDCKACSKMCTADGNLIRPSEDIDERQSANDFEDEIQDFVYIQNPESSIAAEMAKENSRAKRQIEFPDKTEPVPPQQSDRETLRSSSDFYEDAIKADQTRFIITGLRHYTTYAISIRACRQQENEEDSLAVLCSVDSSFYSQTFKQPSNDDIQDFDVETFSNGSSTDVKVFWTPPDNPNGLLLSYQIRHKRIDVEHAQFSSNCLSHNMLNSTRSYLIRGLPPGNYSIDMRATSLAGEGNYTKAKFVYIKESGTNNIWYIFGGLLAIFLISLAILFYAFKRMYLSSISSMKLIANVNPDYAGVTYKQDEWEIPRENVIQLQELGQGSFGMVYEGIIKDPARPGAEEKRCAIKTVNESATDKERCSFLNEASVMKQFDCHHVVRLLGVISRGQPTFVVMELMANGDLKGYLRLHRPEYDTGTDPPQPPTLRQILQMAIEIADGMSYLSAKKFVHRDLAARNCMVAEDMTVKIGDFGMTRDIYETDYYRKGTKGLLPVRWMSPESLKDGVFSSTSDVFSYGVVLWEMATLASQPYQGLSNDQVLRYVIEGGVMERPENCPDKLYELMRRCWQHRPSARPSFMDIINMLLEDVNPKFQTVSFYHSPQGQEIIHQMMQGDLAVQITDDVTTPLRHEEEEDTSSVDGGNRFLMEEYKSGSLDDL